MGGGWWGGVPGLPREDNVYAIACYPCPRKGKSGFFVLKRWTIYEIRFLFYCLSTTKKRLMERIYSSNNFFFFFFNFNFNFNFFGFSMLLWEYDLIRWLYVVSIAIMGFKLGPKRTPIMKWFIDILCLGTFIVIWLDKE
jgi:hypothetical protein